jgi:RES domain-containing protein
MKFFRLAKTRHIHDLLGNGARIAGGRWNEKGTAVLYVSESRALATVEYLVHVPIAIKPKDLSIATLEMPDSISKAMLTAADLPPNWRAYPAPPELAKIGTEWVAAGLELLLFVPSAIVPGEANILINPAHPDMKTVRLLSVENYRFDERLLR